MAHGAVRCGPPFFLGDFAMTEYQSRFAEDLPALLARLLVALVASVALHLGLMQLFSSLPAGKPVPASAPRLTARLAPLPQADAPAPVPAPLQPPVAAASASGAGPAPAPPKTAAPAEPATPQAGSSATNLVRLPAPRYYRSNELDDKPGLAMAITPQYPATAMQTKQGGRVVLRLLINDRGGLDDISVLEAEPAGVFNDSALEAFRSARFVPGKLEGLDVRTQLDLELSYVPGATTTVKAESQMSNGISVQQMRKGPLPWAYRKPASARNSDRKN